MAIYGYAKQTVDPENRLPEMLEVTFDVPFADLRRVAAFLIQCADEADLGIWRSNHRHITSVDQKNLNCDVIVCHQNLDPPLRAH